MTLKIPIVVPVAYENPETKVMQTIGKESRPEDCTFYDVTIYEVNAVEDYITPDGVEHTGYSELHMPGFSFIVRMDRYKLEQLIEEHR